MIDIHTGLGPYGYGTPMPSETDGAARLAAMRTLYGPSLRAVNAEEGSAYEVVGDMSDGLRRNRSGRVLALALEFGTFDTEQLYRLQIEGGRSAF